MLYPTVSDYLGRIHSSQAVSSYNNEVKGIDEATKKQMLEEAQEYNQSLVNTTKLYDPFSTTGKPSKEYMNLLNVSKDGMMAYLQIPKIDVKLLYIIQQIMVFYKKVWGIWKDLLCL